MRVFYPNFKHAFSLYKKALITLISMVFVNAQGVFYSVNTGVEQVLMLGQTCRGVSAY